MDGSYFRNCSMLRSFSSVCPCLYFYLNFVIKVHTFHNQKTLSLHDGPDSYCHNILGYRTGISDFFFNRGRYFCYYKRISKGRASKLFHFSRYIRTLHLHLGTYHDYGKPTGVCIHRISNLFHTKNAPYQDSTESSHTHSSCCHLFGTKASPVLRDAIQSLCLPPDTMCRTSFR